MRLFEISTFSISSYNDSEINGEVGWDDDPVEKQEIRWRYKKFDISPRCLEFLEVAYEAGMIKSDRILILKISSNDRIYETFPETDLILEEIEEFQIDMVNHGVLTDFLFFHR
ncbi:MAG: hypothetical protein AAGF29_05690 [Pseudomonadota bacterium]